MKRILILLFLAICPVVAYADSLEGVINKVYEKGENKLEGFIAEKLFDGPGDTEISFNTKNHGKPEYSIMIVRPINIHDDKLNFYQLQITNNHVLGHARQTLNLGYGHRFLSNDKTKFVGFNTFVDRDIHSNSRMSVGAEIRSSVFEANGNIYKALSESDGAGNDVGSNQERVLDGYDINLVGQIPHMPWANIVYTDYKWIAAKNSKDSEGTILKTEINLSNTLTLEAGFDDNNITKSEEFLKLTYSYPPKDRPTALDGLSDVAFNMSEDVSGEMLTKVRRVNTITVEVEASGVVIARGNN